MSKSQKPTEALAPLVKRRTFVPVTCFVDWNSQLIVTGVDYEKEPVNAARAAFTQTTRRIARTLAKTDLNEKFQVNLRLYHGWRKGYQPTANLLAIRAVIAETDFSTLSDVPSVAFSSNIGFGDRLIAALECRIHAKEGIHLPNTLRERNTKEHEEKMVDTALAADMVVCAYQDPGDWIFLITEDDDLVPPLFTAESIIYAHKGKALLLSKRKRSKNFLLLDGLDAS